MNTGLSMRLVNRLACLTVAGVLAACATVSDPIPQTYSGPLASIADTSQGENANRAVFFYVASIDGKEVDNAYRRSVIENRGRGFSMLSLPYQRDIPATPLTLTLRGEVAYGAPIEAMLNASTMYKVSRTVKFSPKADQVYTIRGRLSADANEVWIESDGRVVPVEDVTDSALADRKR